jgi:two-component system cell cycle response regulator
MPLLPRARPDLLSAELLPEPLESRLSERLYKVALQGFTAFERSSLASFFRLVSDRSPAYELWLSTKDSDFIVADAQRLNGDALPENTVYIGTTAPAGALAVLPRPIDPVNIVKALDARVFELERGLTEVFEFDSMNSKFDPSTVPPRPIRPDQDDDPFFFDEIATVPVPPALTQLSLPLVHPPANWNEGLPKDVLVVDDSPIALRFLEVRLRRLGYQVHRARTSAHANELLAQMSFAFVFLDVTLGEGDGLDGLQICRQLKERNRHPGEAAPVVVMVSGHFTPEDRLKAEFAGCDAYLGKPLDERELVNTLGRHDATFGRTLDPGVPMTARRL